MSVPLNPVLSSSHLKALICYTPESGTKKTAVSSDFITQAIYSRRIYSVFIRDSYHTAAELLVSTPNDIQESNLAGRTRSMLMNNLVPDAQQLPTE